jgi:hypothetical protein
LMIFGFAIPIYRGFHKQNDNSKVLRVVKLVHT